MDDNRDKDKSYKLVPASGSGQTHRLVSLDVVKSAFIAEGLSTKEIAERYFLSESQVERLVEEHKLPELRKAYIRQGMAKIQNEQLGQAQKLLDLELNFKKLKLIQLEKQLEDFLAYFSRHGDFYKRHPIDGKILRDVDGMPIQLHVPNVSKEICQLKESVTLSEGMKKLLTEIDDIINGKPKSQSITDANNVIDMEDIDGYFKKKA